MGNGRVNIVRTRSNDPRWSLARVSWVSVCVLCTIICGNDVWTCATCLLGRLTGQGRVLDGARRRWPVITRLGVRSTLGQQLPDLTWPAIDANRMEPQSRQLCWPCLLGRARCVTEYNLMIVHHDHILLATHAKNRRRRCVSRPGEMRGLDEEKNVNKQGLQSDDMLLLFALFYIITSALIMVAELGLLVWPGASARPLLWLVTTDCVSTIVVHIITGIAHHPLPMVGWLVPAVR